MTEETKFSRKESSITSLPIKVGTNYVNWGKEKASPINSHSIAEPGCSNNSQNEDRINFISHLITKH